MTGKDKYKFDRKRKKNWLWDKRRRGTGKVNKKTINTKLIKVKQRHDKGEVGQEKVKGR